MGGTGTSVLAAARVRVGTNIGRWAVIGMLLVCLPAEPREGSGAASNVTAARRQRWRTRLAVCAEKTARRSHWFELGLIHVQFKILGGSRTASGPTRINRGHSFLLA
jgi:hypothetical protein